MPTPLNPNPVKSPRKYQLEFSRNFQRSYAKHSSGVTHRVTWSGGNILVNAVVILAEPQQPRYLDFSYDQADRPQIVWKSLTGVTSIYYYDALAAAFTTLSLGTIPDQPIIHNDYLLGGQDTIFAYLKDNVPYYRLQSERYGVEHLWDSRQYQGIKGLGYAIGTNSVVLLLGHPPIPEG